MGTSADTIRGWFNNGAAKDNTAYMIVWCDTFDFEDYPAYYADRREAQLALNSPSKMQRAMEVYDLLEPREKQVRQHRCWALKPGDAGSPAGHHGDYVSRYSDKNRSTAPCAAGQCPDPGTKLELRNGQLNWWCDRHATNDRDDH